MNEEVKDTEEVIEETTEEKKKPKYDNTGDYISLLFDNRHFYTIYSQSFGGHNFYKIYTEKKNYDGTKEKVYKNVSFVRGLDIPPNGSKIRIKKAHEDCYLSKANKYERIFIYKINDYELKQNNAQIVEQAQNEYQQTLTENEQENINIDDNFLE